MTRSRTAGSIDDPECGFELRSVNGSFRDARPIHSRARLSLIPAASDASRTDHPCSETRLNSSARLAGHVRAFLCTSIWAPSRQPSFESFQIDESRLDGQPVSRNNVLAHHS